MYSITNACKGLFLITGGVFGWIIAEFKPTFPLIIVTIIFIIYDAWTAYQLDKRVHLRYPTKTQREKAKFTSFAFGKVIKETIPKRLWVIFLAYLVEHWVFIHVSIPLSYIVTGVICFEQAWSILENESSCRSENESRFWKLLQKIMVDKTERHFDVDLGDLKDDGQVTEEQIEQARRLLAEYDKQKKKDETD
jgi:hypothetical protein